MNILSIDWDYFIDVTDTQRSRLFPDGGNENLSIDIQNIIWMTHYQNPALEKIESIPECRMIKDIIIEHVSYEKPTMIADSHKHIYEFIKEHFSTNEPINLVNVDFHHDLFKIKKIGEVDCGNWLKYIMLEFPESSTYSWISRVDSDIEDMATSKGQLNIFKEDLEILKQNWDAVYICRSGMWSPPHLDHVFIDTFKWMKDSYFLKYETTVFDDRYDEKFIEAINTFRKSMKTMKPDIQG